MSMYHLVHGENPLADLILGSLNLTRADVGRYRDAFITPEKEIAIYTRNGGGNRDLYQDVIDRLSQHPGYLRDTDDDFDCTYATFYFTIPTEAEAILLPLMEKEWNPDQRWLDALEAIKDGKKPEVVEKFRPLMEKIVKAFNS